MSDQSKPSGAMSSESVDSAASLFDAVSKQFANLSDNAPIEEINQLRANMIDLTHQAGPLAASLTSSSIAMKARQLALTAERETLDENSTAYIKNTTKLAGINAELKHLREGTSNVTTQVNFLNASLVDLAKRAIDAEKATKSITKKQGETLFKEGAKALQGLAAGLPAGLATAATHGVGILTSSASKVVPVVGALSAILSLYAATVARSTRQTASLVNTFGAMSNSYEDAQGIFKREVGYQYLYNIAEAEKFLNNVRKDGAFSAYTASAAGVRLSETLDNGASIMMPIMAKLTDTMISVGRATGMTDDQSAAFLSKMAIVGTIFGDLEAAVGKEGVWAKRLNSIVDGFNSATLAGVGSFGLLTNMFLDFSKVTRGLGQDSFTTAGNVLGMSKAIHDYAASSNAVSAQVLKQEQGMKDFVSTLFQLGQKLTTAQTAGYGMLTGAYAAGGSSFETIARAATATPLNKLGMQLKAYGDLSKGNTDMFISMLAQSGVSGQVLKTLQDMKQNKEGAAQYEKMVELLNKGGYTQEEFNQLSTGNNSGFREIANRLEMGKSPMTKLVEITGSIYDLISSWRIFGSAPGSGAVSKSIRKSNSASRIIG